MLYKAIIMPMGSRVFQGKHAKWKIRRKGEKEGSSLPGA